MSLTHRNAIAEAHGALMEKVLIKNDLSGLTPLEKVQHIKNICNSLGLNPLTKPIQLLAFQGKEVPYVTKDATEQLRKLNKVSISDIGTNLIDGAIYVVTAHANTPDGRTDASTGAISISGLKGDALCNAMLKAETKAKRRVTLSICGLGFMDESEIESIPNSKRVVLTDVTEKPKQLSAPAVTPEVDETLRMDCMEGIKSATTLKELEHNFTTAKSFLKNDKDGLSMLIKEKDDKKLEIITKEFDAVDVETGEVQG